MTQQEPVDTRTCRKCHRGTGQVKSWTVGLAPVGEDFCGECAGHYTRQPKTSPCRGCQASMIWVRTPKGKNMCLDPDPVHVRERGHFRLVDSPEGQLAVYAEPGDVGPFYTSHWATCPEASRFRR